jgi:hypothetical protein
MTGLGICGLIHHTVSLRLFTVHTLAMAAQSAISTVMTGPLRAQGNGVALSAFSLLPLVIPGHVYDSVVLGVVASLPTPPSLVVCTWSCEYNVMYVILRL